MATYEITAPDGATYEVTAPDGATEQDVLAYAQSQFAKQEFKQGLQLAQPEELDINRARGEVAVRGATLGTSDITMPFLGALYAKAFGGDATADIPLEQLIEEAQTNVTGRRQRYREERPVESTAIEAVSSMPAGLGLFKAAQAAGLGTLPAVSAASAAEGFGLAEGDLADKATVGAASAVASPLLAKGTQLAAPQLAKGVRAISEGLIDPTKRYLSNMVRVNPTAAKEFIEEGIPASWITFTDNPTILRLGSLLKGTFGSTNVMIKNIDETLDGLQTAINKKAFSTGRSVTPQEAGSTVQRGVTNYIEKFRTKSDELYDRVGRFIDKDTLSNLNNVQKLVSEELANTASAPKLKKKLLSNKGLALALDAIEDMGGTAQKANLVTMTTGGADIGLRYKNLKNYRTLVGNQIKENVVSGADNALNKRVYAALTKDMEVVAKQSGPKAYRAFKNANAYYNNGLEQIEKRLSKYVNTNADPGRILAQLRTASKGGDFKIRSIINAVDPQDRPVIRDAVLQQLGQNSQGDFSPALFFRDYNKISKEAKVILFGADDVAFRQSLDRLARISKRMGASGRFDNVSRSADNLGNLGLLALGALDPVSAGQTGLAAAGASRLLTNRRFAEWLVKQSSKPIKASSVTKMLKGLERMALRYPAMQNDIMAFIAVFGANAAAAMENQQ